MTRQAARTITTLAGLLVSLLITVVGSVVLFWGTSLPAEQEFLRENVKSIGSILVGIGALSLLWELFTKRSFLEETLALVNSTVELKNAGIERVSNRYLNELQWGEMLRAAPTLEFFFAYGRTWCNVNTIALSDVVRLKHRTIRVLLPDPGNPQVVGELVRRFNSSPQDVETAIKETRAFFERLGSRTGEGTVVEVRYAAATPLFTMYLMGERAVFSLHSHQQKRGNVPTCVVRHDGTLFQYLEEEFRYVWQVASVAYDSRAVAPPPPAPAPAPAAAPSSPTP